MKGIDSNRDVAGKVSTANSTLVPEDKSEEHRFKEVELIEEQAHQETLLNVEEAVHQGIPEKEQQKCEEMVFTEENIFFDMPYEEAIAILSEKTRKFQEGIIKSRREMNQQLSEFDKKFKNFLEGTEVMKAEVKAIEEKREEIGRESERELKELEDIHLRLIQEINRRKALVLPNGKLL